MSLATTSAAWGFSTMFTRKIVRIRRSVNAPRCGLSVTRIATIKIAAWTASATHSRAGCGEGWNKATEDIVSGKRNNICTGTRDENGARSARAGGEKRCVCAHRQQPFHVCTRLTRLLRERPLCEQTHPVTPIRQTCVVHCEDQRRVDHDSSGAGGAISGLQRAHCQGKKREAKCERLPQPRIRNSRG